MVRYKYTISRHTKVIMAHGTSYYKSRVYEGDRWWNVIQSPEAILEANCFANRATLKGQRDYVKKMLGIAYKIPVPVIPDMGVFLFPTTSPRNEDCAWVALDLIKSYGKINNQICVVFLDGTHVLLDVSLNVFERQYSKTALLKILMTRPAYYNQIDSFPQKPDPTLQ